MQTSVPPPPEKPDADDCCGSGCVPCVFDLYDRQLFDWLARYGDQKPAQKDQPRSRIMTEVKNEST